MKRFLRMLILVGLFAALAGVATATPPSGVTSTSLAIGRADEIDVKTRTGDWKIRLKTNGDSDVAVVENRVAPGGHFGWHSHPGPSLVVVKSGTATEYLAEDPCTPVVHEAGEAFVDPGGHAHIVRNESSTEDLVVVVTRLLPPGAAPRIDAPAPSSCAPDEDTDSEEEEDD
jgi:quercetin dioxygenase-like cupin family protein